MCMPLIDELEAHVSRQANTLHHVSGSCGSSGLVLFLHLGLVPFVVHVATCQLHYPRFTALSSRLITTILRSCYAQPATSGGQRSQHIHGLARSWSSHSITSITGAVEPSVWCRILLHHASMQAECPGPWLIPWLLTPAPHTYMIPHSASTPHVLPF